MNMKKKPIAIKYTMKHDMKVNVYEDLLPFQRKRDGNLLRKLFGSPGLSDGS